MFDRKGYMKVYNQQYRLKNHDKIQEYDRIRHCKKITFKDKRITLNNNPRTGSCSQCGQQGLTHIHHFSYHANDPLKDTKELCASCHAYETWKLRPRKHLNYPKYNIVLQMITAKTQVSVHEDTREMLTVFKMEAYRKGLISKPSANDAIVYLLQKVGRESK